MLVREFKHLAVDMFIVEEDGAKKLKVEAHFGKRKALASIRTVCSHVTVRTYHRRMHHQDRAALPICLGISRKGTATSIMEAPAHPLDALSIGISIRLHSHSTSDLCDVLC